MTIYFVDFINGLDANNGLGPDASHATNKPWKTIAKLLGAAGMASGDTAHLSPAGPFRETVSVAMTSAVAETFILGDPTNAQGFKSSGGVLVVPGEVILTAYTTNDTTAPAATVTLNLNGRDFLTFQYLTIIGGNASPSCVTAVTTNSVNIVFRDCKMISGHVSNSVLSYTGLADIASNWIIDRCRVFCYSNNAIAITLPTSASADYDSNFSIQNSEVVCLNSNGISVAATGAAAFKAGGVDVLNCTLITRSCALTTTGANLSTAIPCTCNNSLIISGAGAALNANAVGQITENYCRIISASPRTNVTAGANSIADMSHAPLIDLGFPQQLGFMSRPYWGASANSPLLGFGSVGAPLVDILNRPRPSGGASIVNAVGAYERHDIAIQETSVTQAGASAIKIIGPGDHDFQIPVDASSTTISIYMRYDTNHAATNKPQAILLANAAIGVATETKTMTAVVDTWEQLTFSAITPTSKGIVTIRLISRSAAGNGIAYFDSASVV